MAEMNDATKISVVDPTGMPSLSQRFRSGEAHDQEDCEGISREQDNRITKTVAMLIS